MLSSQAYKSKPAQGEFLGLVHYKKNSYYLKEDEINVIIAKNLSKAIKTALEIGSILCLTTSFRISAPF